MYRHLTLASCKSYHMSTCRNGVMNEKWSEKYVKGSCQMRPDKSHDVNLLRH